MNKLLMDKINFLTEISCWDHYKTRDMIYNIDVNYHAYDQKVKYYPYHNGYLWEFPDHEYKNADRMFPRKTEYDTYEEAEKALENAVDNQIKEEFEWFERSLKNPYEYDVCGSPIIKEEDLEEYKKRYNEIRNR